MGVRLSARIGAFACLGVAAAVAMLSLREASEPVPVPAILSTDLPNDPLRETLRSCQLAGQAAGSDPGCLAAWAENRRRFLGTGARIGRDGGPAPSLGKLPQAALPPGDANATFGQEN